jgi:hypothetical protein
MLKRIRQALWLIEVLVVLVVIEILIGLVSPAEQRPYEFAYSFSLTLKLDQFAIVRNKFYVSNSKFLSVVLNE